MKKRYFSLILGCLMLLTQFALEAQTFHIQEDFSAGNLPTGWSNSAVSGTHQWLFGNDGYSLYPGNNSIDSSNMAYFDDDDIGQSKKNNTVQLVTPAFNNKAFYTTYLEFDYNFRDVDTTSILDSFYVEVFDGVNWNLVFSVKVDDCGRYTSTSGPTICEINGFPKASIDISSFADSACMVRFTYHDGNDWAWYAAIDNVEIYSPVQRFLHTPIEGIYGKDYTLVNYVDWGFIGFKDAYCGTKSYDWHEGTDFTIRSFRQMDSGVFVLAADTGIVTFVKDSLFDRETISDTSKHLGNYISIKHPNGYFSYYGHLKKHSLLVNMGDTVSAKQQIAQVGSSGNSSDPHLHFELRYDSLYVVDPFNGNCGNDSTLWLTPLAYDTSLAVWEDGLYLKNININTLRERDSSTICCPYELQAGHDTLTYWTHLLGLRTGDTLSINWYDSSNVNRFSYDFIQQKDWWYYYFWSYIFTDSLSEGQWEVQLLRNDSLISSENFRVKPPLSTSIIEAIAKKEECIKFTEYSKESINQLLQKNKIQVYSIQGQKYNPIQFFRSPESFSKSQSIYLVKINSQSNTCTYKVRR